MSYLGCSWAYFRYYLLSCCWRFLSCSGKIWAILRFLYEITFTKNSPRTVSWKLASIKQGSTFLLCHLPFSLFSALFLPDHHGSFLSSSGYSAQYPGTCAFSTSSLFMILIYQELCRGSLLATEL